MADTKIEWTDKFQSLSRDFRPCGPAPVPQLPRRAFEFQSLSRDSVHVDAAIGCDSQPVLTFQSLSRDSVHVDSEGDAECLTFGRSFNPSVGIPSMWTRPGQSVTP